MSDPKKDFDENESKKVPNARPEKSELQEGSSHVEGEDILQDESTPSVSAAPIDTFESNLQNAASEASTSIGDTVEQATAAYTPPTPPQTPQPASVPAQPPVPPFVAPQQVDQSTHTSQPQPPYQQGNAYPPINQQTGYYPPSAQQPYQQAQGYPANAQQPYSNYGSMGNQPPIPQQQAYAQQPPKKKVWPWVLLACILVALLGLGGCVGCIAYTVMLAENETSSLRDYAYTPDDSYHDEYGYDYRYDNENGSSSQYTYTLDEIKELGEGLPNEIDGTTYSPGVYEVGKDIKPGLYFMEGSQSEEGQYVLFEPEKKGSYEMIALVSYFGNYFVELEEGEVILFTEPEAAKMYPATKESFEIKETDPYLSGCYRVGIDIEPGTYTVSVQSNVPSSASQNSAAYIMKDLSWDDDSVVETHYVSAGRSATITVSDGQYLELYGATMTSGSGGGQLVNNGAVV